MYCLLIIVILQNEYIGIMQLKKKRWHCLPGQEPTDMDLKIMALEKKGKLVPTRDLIKTPEQIEGIRKSGVVNTGCLDAD